MHKNDVGVCVHFCSRPLVPLERCVCRCREFDMLKVLIMKLEKILKSLTSQISDVEHNLMVFDLPIKPL